MNGIIRDTLKPERLLPGADKAKTSERFSFGLARVTELILSRHLRIASIMVGA